MTSKQRLALAKAAGLLDIQRECIVKVDGDIPFVLDPDGNWTTLWVHGSRTVTDDNELKSIDKVFIKDIYKQYKAFDKAFKEACHGKN